MEFRKMVTITLYTRQQKRHWCMEQSFGLCGRGRGWDDLGEWHWNMYNIIYETSRQSRFDARFWMLGAGALGYPSLFSLPPLSHPTPLGHPSSPAPSIQYRALNLDWRLVSYMILYVFQCHSPNHPTLSLSHRVQKTVLYISVSFAVSYTGLLLPSRGMVWGGRREEGSGWGTHVYLWQIHFDIWQNQYNIVKLNKIKF